MTLSLTATDVGDSIIACKSKYLSLVPLFACVRLLPMTFSPAQLTANSYAGHKQAAD